MNARNRCDLSATGLLYWSFGDGSGAVTDAGEGARLLTCTSILRSSPVERFLNLSGILLRVLGGCVFSHLYATFVRTDANLALWCRWLNQEAWIPVAFVSQRTRPAVKPVVPDFNRNAFLLPSEIAFVSGQADHQDGVTW